MSVTQKMDIGSSILSDITVFSKYGKYIPELKRRETWSEIIDRYRDMMIKKYPQLEKTILKNIEFIYQKKVLPSMRALQFAGPAMEVNNARGYNCSYLPIDSVYSFSETMFLLLGGSGVGYSVQKRHIDQLPEIKRAKRRRKYLIEDSIMGWADAIKMTLKGYFGLGPMADLDFRAIRPKGARLVTAGGKAPGPDPLMWCIDNIVDILDRKNDGEKLTDIECHDILCHIANSVLAGGIRRSAMICLFDIDSENMLRCKSNFPVLDWEHQYKERKEMDEIEKIHIVHIDEATGKKFYSLNVRVNEPHYGVSIQHPSWVAEEDLEMLKKTNTLPWYYFQEQRGRSNNSVVLQRGEVDQFQFQELWKKVEDSRAGEPGFYWTNNKDWGTNPCCEIGLRPFQMCNLCEINGSNIESQTELNERAEVAAFFGTLQAGFTDFHYLRPIWKETCEKDALLGVGITGIGSGKLQNLNLEEASSIVNSTNIYYAAQIGINPAARTTCIKPSGTTSLVLGSSSGIHGWHDYYYLRTMRFNKKEDLALYLMFNHPEFCEDDFYSKDTTICVRIPVKAPETAILRSESPIDLLERVKRFTVEWIRPGHRTGDNTHNVSATISIRNEEWQEVGNWMWNNREFYNGLSVLPYDTGTYQQPPFESIDEEHYNNLVKGLRNIDLTRVQEIDDTVNFGLTEACAGGKCEV